MAISFTRYIDITSGVGAGASVGQRDLIGRLFTTNNLVPPNSFVEFSGGPSAALADVGTYFGTGSDEYARASFYFGWVSKNITAPQKISFARWVNADVGSMIFGKVANYTLSTFTAISSGGFTLTLGGHTHALSGINLSAASDLATVASDVQTAIRAYSAGGTAWTGATVTYDAVRKSFDLVSGATGADTIAVAAAGSGTDLAGPLGWLTGAILCNGATAQSITDVLTESAAASNNFGSFLFMPALSVSQITEAATWNTAQNVDYQYMIPAPVESASAISAAVLNDAGCAITLSPLSSEYPEQCPMMIMAATDYNAANSVQNYMFQQFNLTPSVTTDADADTYDALRVNYYGQTQTAGQYISFYQRGVLTGLSTNPTDQNTYANEQWLKDAIGAKIMTLLLALSNVSANSTGRSQLLAIIQSVIQQALTNGTISVGKPLTTTQQLYITQVTNDPKAWYQVQNSGYWVDCVIEPYTVDGVTEYKAVYTLVYSKDDVIRLVQGSDILI